MDRIHEHIIVVGPIGSGKTTVSQLLAHELNVPLVDADTYEENPFLPDYIQDNPRWAFATELFFTIARIKKLSTLSQILKKSDVVVDSGLIMSQEVYTKNHLVRGTITAAEWEFYCTIIDHYRSSIPSPTAIVHLQAPVATQLERIRVRGRGYESGYTEEYLQSITDRLSEYADSLQNYPEIRYISVDTTSHDTTTPVGSKSILTEIKAKLK